MSDNLKFPRAVAKAVADDLIGLLKPHCENGFLTVAGSYRRGREQVGDLEIVYVSKISEAKLPGELFGEPRQTVDGILELLLAGKLERRDRSDGLSTWGSHIKLARHRETGLPVDFFPTTRESWFNYLVCRTGPKESNMAICRAAQARGYKWKPYSPGFCYADDPKERVENAMTSEEAVFAFVGLPYRPPEER